jgi:ligand-binding sensor domain-containing protein
MKLRHFFSSLFVLAVCISFLATISQAYVGGNWITYTTKNSGLASNDVRAIGMDSNGIMWFGTANGLSRFDGVNWTTYTTLNKLAHNTVNTIMYEFGPYGNEIWVGTEGGVNVISSKPDAVTIATPYTTTNTKYPGMISDKIYSAAVDTSHVRWFGTDKGLMSFNGTLWKAYTASDTTSHRLPDNHVNAIAYETTKNGPEIWIGTNNGISVASTKIDAVSFATPYTTTNTKYPGMISNTILAAAVDTRNVKWFGTDKGVTSFDGSKFQSYTTLDFLSDNHVTSIAVDKSNMIYFGTVSGGVSRFDGVSSASPLDTNWSPIASNNIRAVQVGLHGALWFATDQGVTRYIPEGTSVQESAALPGALSIRGIFPNPFNPSTTIVFSLPKNGQATLAVYNLSGQKIRELVAGVVTAGNHSVRWDGRDDTGKIVSSGVYISRLHMGTRTSSQSMLLLK